MRRWRCGSELGQSLVEFAMVVPLLLLIVFAIIDFGRILQGHVSLTNAVREGARVGAVNKPDEIEERVLTAASGLSPTVSITTASESGDPVIVSATATVQLITPLGNLISMFGGGMSNSFTISVSANMRRE